MVEQYELGKDSFGEVHMFIYFTEIPVEWNNAKWIFKPRLHYAQFLVRHG
jgi:hypothetical protein